MKKQFIVIADVRGGVKGYYGPFNSWETAMAACEEVKRDFHIPENTWMRIEELNTIDYS